jgi:hypothetical protein
MVGVEFESNGQGHLVLEWDQEYIFLFGDNHLEGWHGSEVGVSVLM